MNNEFFKRGRAFLQQPISGVSITVTVGHRQAIFGTRAGRTGAELKVMAAIEAKLPCRTQDSVFRKKRMCLSCVNLRFVTFLITCI